MFEDLPVKVGVVYEGERIRGPDTFLELGGPKVEYKAELVQIADEENIKDGSVKIIGKDIQDFNEGDRTPLFILVEVYGKNIEKDLEPVIERRIHDFINYVQGVMHLNQRYDIWLRINKESAKAGLTFEHLGKAVLALFRKEFPFIKKMQITFITEPDKVKEEHAKASEIYEARDKRVRGMKDDEVEEFYGCTLCQSFAPNHVCVISPQRVSLCGSISWLDARAAYKVDPDGPNFAIQKGEVLDEKVGEYAGVNEAVKKYTNGANDRFFMYSMFGHPHTSCGCFEAIAFYIPEVDGIGIVDRHYTNPTVNGLKFSSMATQTGGGEQVEGFLGFGIQWLYSEKLLYPEGGWGRIVWMPSKLKEKVKDAIPQVMYDKIPTENDVNDINDLKNVLKEKGHPVVNRWKEEESVEEVEESAPEVSAPTMQMTVPQQGDTIQGIITLPRMSMSAGQGITVILKNAKIYAENVIIKRTDEKKR